MTQDEIKQMFEGRWRIYGFEDLDDSETRMLTGKEIKQKCFEFFTAGIVLGGIGDYTTDGPIAYNDFDVFWNAYQKKVGRPKCEKLWQRLTEKEKADCIAYIPYYVQAQPDKQFRKNPETFLRNKSWHDEIINRNYSEQQQQQRLEAAARVIAEYTK